MTARCSTPEMICLQCGDRGWSNAFVYCVKCINVAVHRYCLDVIPNTANEFVRWICDDCSSAPSNLSSVTPSISSAPSSSTAPATGSLRPAPTPTPLASAGEAAAPAPTPVVCLFFRQRAAMELAESSTSGHEERDWDWKRADTQRLKPRINLHYKPKYLPIIKDKLKSVGGDELLQRLGEGCFGHFLGWRSTESNGRALHALISREIEKTGAPKHEKWFRVCGQNIRFSYPEYALITGLKFGHSDFDPSAEYEVDGVGLIARFCRGDSVITLQKLWDKFTAPERASPEDYDYLKVANLLVLYIFSMGYNMNRRVDKFAWILVDNLQQWNEFPWGAYTYQVLMQYMKQLPEDATSCGSYYHFFGPVWALQIWAYEAIPDLGAICATIYAPATLPRGLKWLFIRAKQQEFNDFFDTKEHECHMTLEPTSNEVERAYWITAQGPNALGVKYCHTINPIYGLVEDGEVVHRHKMLARKVVVRSKVCKTVERPRIKRAKKNVGSEEAAEPSAMAVKRKHVPSSEVSPSQSSRCEALMLQQVTDAADRRDAEMMAKVTQAMDGREAALLAKVKEGLLPYVKDFLMYDMLPEMKRFVKALWKKERDVCM